MRLFESNQWEVDQWLQALTNDIEEKSHSSWQQFGTSFESLDFEKDFVNYESGTECFQLSFEEEGCTPTCNTVKIQEVKEVLSFTIDETFTSSLCSPTNTKTGLLARFSEAN